MLDAPRGERSHSRSGYRKLNYSSESDLLFSAEDPQFNPQTPLPHASSLSDSISLKQIFSMQVQDFKHAGRLSAQTDEFLL